VITIPNNIDNLFDQAIHLTDQGNVQQAIHCYEQIIQRQPDHTISYNNMGILFNSLKQYDQASHCFEKATQYNPNYAKAWFNWGNALKNQGNFQLAIQKYTAAIQSNPQLSGAYNNMGECFGHLNDPNTAIKCFKIAIDIHPTSVGTYYNLGNIFYKSHRYEEAIDYYRKCISIQPDFSDAHYNLSFALLLTGDYMNGFSEYEWRLKRGPFTGDCFTQPFWDGKDISDKTLFVYSEQGFGDSIHFCRYLPVISKRVEKLIFGCRKEQARLFETIIGVDQVIVQGDSVPEFDFQCSLLSLPHLLKTDHSTIPCDTPYVFPNFSTPPQQIDRLIEKTSSQQIRIGIVWGGNPENKNDHVRSVSLKTMAQLFAIKNIQWFSFQKGPQAKEINEYSLQVIDLSEFLNDFYDTACGLSQMDLLITVDTSVAHLAGALGIPVWILIPDQPDWRWLLGRSDNPWYPTCLLFRRAQNENWEIVMDRIKKNLYSIVDQKPFPVVETYFKDAIQSLNQKEEFKARLAFQKILSTYSTMWESELNLSALFFKSNNCFASILYGQRACRRQINLAVSWQNLGIVYHDCGNQTKAIDCYKKAQKNSPNDPRINYELGKLMIQNGQWTKGLPLFEYRRFCHYLPKRRQYDIPYWDGKSFHGKTLLLYSDYGPIGLILYLRFVSQVKSYGGNVILESPPDMYRLLVDLPCIDRIFFYNKVLDSESQYIFDYQLSLQSIPYILGIQKEDIQQRAPYLQKRKDYVPLLEAIHHHKGLLNIGLSWFISDDPDDIFINTLKRIILSFENNDISLFYINFNRLQDDLFEFSDNLIDLSSYIDDYSDLASAIAEMDIILTTDNPAGHLAGAMYKKVLMMLPTVPNWYWNLNTEQSDWYSTMKLFRPCHLTDNQQIQSTIIKNLTERLIEKQSTIEEKSEINTSLKSETMLIHALGYFDGFTGFHVHTRSFFNALKRFVPVLETEMQLDSRLNNSIHYLNQTILPRRTDIINIAIRSIHRLEILSSCPGQKIGYVVFESNHIPYDWLPSLECADKLWTPSQWGKEVLMNHGFKDDAIDIIPEGVDTKIFQIKGTYIEEIKKIKAYKFLYVGKFEKRKGTKLLIRVFDETFKDNDHVRLVLCSHTYKKDFDFKNFIKQLELHHPEKIIRVGPFARNENLADLYRSCNAFVIPTRAEGWGLPVIEAMACGLPVIVTGYSGLTEYATNKNAFLIDYELEKIRKPFGLQVESQSTNYGEWAKPDIEHLKELMQYIVKNPEQAKKRGYKASEEVHLKWSWQHAAQKAFQAIHKMIR